MEQNMSVSTKSSKKGYHLERGIDWIKNWFANQQINKIKVYGSIIYGEKNNRRYGVSVIKRDHHKENPFEVATIKAQDYIRTDKMFRSLQLIESYVLIARTFREDEVFLKENCYMVLLPEKILKKHLLRKTHSGSKPTLNIGFTYEQRLRWESEGAYYFPFFPGTMDSLVDKNKFESNISREDLMQNSISNPKNDLDEKKKKEYEEGKEQLRLHKYRERDPLLIKEAKKRFIRLNGDLFCEACGINFEKVYGERGKNFIEGHHKKPVSEMKEGETTRVEDIGMLCSNCHSMIHRIPIISIEDLKQSLKLRWEEW